MADRPKDVAQLDPHAATAVLLKAVKRTFELLDVTPFEPNGAPHECANTNASPIGPGHAWLQMVQIYEQLTEVMGGDVEAMKAWWHSNNLALEGKPDEVARSKSGREKIIAYLGFMASHQ